MEQIPFGLSQTIVDSAVADARAQCSARLIDVLRDIKHQDQLKPLIGDFAAALSRTYAENLLLNDFDPSHLTKQWLWHDGPWRDLSRAFWHPWDDFLGDTWTHDLKHAENDPFPFLLSKLPVRSLLEAEALRRMDEVLADIRDQPPARRPTGSPNPRAGRGTPRATTDGFIQRCKQEMSLRVTRTQIWRAVGHTTARQFQYWQASDSKATAQDDQNFRRILAMSPGEFEDLLRKKGLI